MPGYDHFHHRSDSYKTLQFLKVKETVGLKIFSFTETVGRKHLRTFDIRLGHLELLLQEVRRQIAKYLALEPHRRCAVGRQISYVNTLKHRTHHVLVVSCDETSWCGGKERLTNSNQGWYRINKKFFRRSYKYIKVRRCRRGSLISAGHTQSSERFVFNVFVFVADKIHQRIENILTDGDLR